MKLTKVATVVVALIACPDAEAQSWWSRYSGQPTPIAQMQSPTAQGVTQKSSPTEQGSLPPAPTSQSQRSPLIPPVAVPVPVSAVAPAQQIVLLPGDIAKAYDILGNVEAEVKGRDSEPQVKAALQEKAAGVYGSRVNAIIFYKAEMRVANILAGYGLKGGFKWVATGVAVQIK